MSNPEDTLDNLPDLSQEIQNVEPNEGETSDISSIEIKEKETTDKEEDSIFQEMRNIVSDLGDASPVDELKEESKKDDSCEDGESNPQINVEDLENAHDEMNEVDVVVCGGCHSVYHFPEDLINHKPQCRRVSSFRNTSLEMKPQVWAFLLWKNAQGKVNRHGVSVEESSWKLYQKWCKMPDRIRSAWVAAGEAVMNYTTFGNQSKEQSPMLQPKVVTKRVDKDLLLPCSEEAENKPVILRKLVQRDHTGEIKEIRPTEPINPPAVAGAAVNTNNISRPVMKPKTLIDDIENIRNQLEGNDVESSNKIGDLTNGDTLKEEEFVVEKIVSRRFNQKKKQYEYLLKWEGYPPEQNTWEPAENLETCQHLLKSFEESLARQAMANRNKVKREIVGPSLGSPTSAGNSSGGRPIRHSKQKALNQVKQWCGSIRPDELESDAVKRKFDDSDDDDFLTKKIKADLESDDDSSVPSAKILYTKPGGQSGIVKRVGRAGRPPKNRLPSDAHANGEAALSNSLSLMPEDAERLPLSMLNRKATVSNLSPINQQVLVANAKGVLQVDPSQVPNLTSGVYIMSNKSIVKLDSVTPSKVAQLKQSHAKTVVSLQQQQQSQVPNQQQQVKQTNDVQVIPSSGGGQVVMIKNSANAIPGSVGSASVACSVQKSGIVRRNPGILKQSSQPTRGGSAKPLSQIRLTSFSSPRMQSGIIPRSSVSAASGTARMRSVGGGVVGRTAVTQQPLKKIIDDKKSANANKAGRGGLKSGIHRKSTLSKEMPLMVPDSPPRPLTLCPLTGKVLSRAEGEKTPQPSPPRSPQMANNSTVVSAVTATSITSTASMPTVTNSASNVTTMQSGIVQQQAATLSRMQHQQSTSIQIGGKNEIGKAENGGFITLSGAMVADRSNNSTTTKALFVNTSSGVTTSEVLHSGVVKKLSPDSAEPTVRSEFILPDNDDDMVTITGEDGLIYKVSNSDLGQLLGGGEGDGEQCVYVTEGGDEGVLQLSNYGQSLATQVVNAEGETEYLMKDVAGTASTGSEGLVLMSGNQENEEPSGQVVAQLVEAGESLPGGQRRVVLLLPDGKLMVTEVDEEQFAALELDK